MRPFVIPAALLPVCLAVGCIPPAEQETARYRNLLDPDGSAAAAGPPPPGGSLDLPTALKLTIRSSERLAVSGEDYLQALIERDRQFAGFLPAISFALRFNRIGDFTGREDFSPAGADDFLPLQPVDLPFTFSMNLFNGFRDYNGVRRAYAAAADREALLRNLLADVLLETAQVYYQTLRAEAAVRVLADNAAVQESRLRDLRLRLEAGTGRPLDVAQAEADLAIVRAELIAARREVRNARHLLAFLIGTESADWPLVDPQDPPPDPGDDEPLVAAARANREDLRAAEARIAAAEREVSIALGAYLPTVGVDLNLFAYRESFPQRSLFDFILRAAQPILNAELIGNDVRTALSRLRQSEMSAKELYRRIRREVLDAAADVRAARERTAALETAVKAAAESRRQAAERFREGFATNLDVLAAQNRVLRAEVELETERLTAKSLHLRLQRLVGRFPTRASEAAAPQPGGG